MIATGSKGLLGGNSSFSSDAKSRSFHALGHYGCVTDQSQKKINSRSSSVLFKLKQLEDFGHFTSMPFLLQYLSLRKLLIGV